MFKRIGKEVSLRSEKGWMCFALRFGEKEGRTGIRSRCFA